MTISDTYRFFWDYPGQGYIQTYPANDSLIWSWQKEEDEVYWRKHLESELVFIKHVPPELGTEYNGYKKLIVLERSKRRYQGIGLIIEQKCKGDWVQVWKGKIHFVDGKYDLNKCEIRVKPRIDDIYTCIYKDWDEEQNMIDLLGAEDFVFLVSKYKVFLNFTTSTSQDPTTPAHLTGNTLTEASFGTDAGGVYNKNTDGLDYSYALPVKQIAKAGGTEDDNTDDIDNWTITTIYAYEVYEANCDALDPPDAPEGDGWLLLSGSACANFFGPSNQWEYVWMRPARGFYCDVESSMTFDNTSQVWTYEKVCVPAFYDVDPFDDKFYLSDFYQVPRQPKHFDNGFKFNDLLEVLCETCGLTLTSNFFGINADSRNPNNAAYTYAANNLQNLSVFQLTDISNPDAEENATKANVTLKQILSDLKIIFNVYWDVDDGYIRLEHISFFWNEPRLDLTTSSFLKFIEGIKSYEYAPPEFPKFEEWQWKYKSDKDTTQDFDGIPIKYDSDFIDEEDTTSNYNSELFVTNFAFFSQNSDFQEDDGLFLLATDGDERTVTFQINRRTAVDAKVVSSGISALTGSQKANISLSIPNLIENLHRWDRPQPRGIVNNSETEFESVIRPRKTNEYKVPLCCTEINNNFDPRDLVKTQLGWGEVESATYEEPLGILTVSLRLD